MQNRGFVKFFAIALSLICLFYLSFSLATRHQTDKAQQLATGKNNKIDQEKYDKYIDSISTEKVWLGYTYKECLEREISLGLDLKGGMNVTLEISVADILKTLSNNSTDPTFTKALELASERQHKSSQKDFLTLFQQAYTEIDKDARLSVVFSTFELKDKITLNSTNAQVMTVLRKEVSGAINNSFNVLRSRIDHFGVVQPNIQRLEDMGRILVELPGVKDQKRVRKLLQGTANLEFFETYDLPDIYQNIVTANTVLKNIQADKKDTTKVVADKKEISSVKNKKSDVAGIDSLLTQSTSSKKDSVSANKGKNKSKEEFAKTNPLFSVLQLSQNPGPVVGYAMVSDTAKVNQYFAMKAVKDVLPRDLHLKWSIKAVDTKGNLFELVAIRITNRDGKAPLEGNVITDARDDFGQGGSKAEVSMTMDAEGSKTWARLTKENIGKSIAIVLDGYVYSFPRVNAEITGGRSQITGNFTPEEAKDLANVLKSGTMPAPARIVQEDIVGPSLGQEAINSGMMSFAIAFVMVLIYMFFYYGLIPGLVADFALLINLFFLMGILVAWRATLTLPGIAGIVLTMGMAVDSNVLIYERIREELQAGKNAKNAVVDGFKGAISAILDSNIVTLLTGVILAWFGTGPIQGFATTLIIGILTSVFTAVFVTHIILEWLADKDKLKNVNFTSKITKNWLQHTKFDFVKFRKKTYVLSAIFVTVSLGSLLTRGLNQGIDFSGGRNYIVRFEKSVSTQAIEHALKSSFDGEIVTVTTIGSDNQVRISTNYKITNNSETINDDIESRLYKGLEPMFVHKISNEMFVKGYIINAKGEPQLSPEAKKGSFGIQSSQKVGPTIADDIKTSAFLAVLISVIGIGLYILFRFRDLAFSAGAVASVLHDALFTLGAYSLFYSIMPFSLEIDQQFIAAVLTVIGYSITDTVVIFDRIRENKGLYPNKVRKDLINDSLNVTLRRTFSTSCTVILVLVVIFIFGGDVIRGFIFALLLGVSVGFYSTLFVAVPLAYDIQEHRDKKKNKALKAAIKK
jgi:SecD/SecF fusion protein